LSGVPKAAARRAMVRQLERLELAWPQHEIKLSLTDNFEHSLQLGGAEYSDRLMNSVVCVAPRGTRMETWRIFEGLRYGCVVVSQRLPDRWFYRGSPIIEIARWEEFAAVLADLIADMSRLDELHRRGLTWWREVCSPAAIARRIAPLVDHAATGREADAPWG
jgi:hypothetical protein